jgi:subtilisin family serine protease
VTRCTLAAGLVLLALAVSPAALAEPSSPPARYAVGLAPGADAVALAVQLSARGAQSVETLAPIRALVATTSRPAALAALPGVRYVEPLRVRHSSFDPDDPLVPRQWYLAQNRAYDSWAALPPLAPVRVAVIDSGVDVGHPELAGRIAGARSFVGGSAKIDRFGHGTFVAGLIAASADNATGIAGLAPSAELLVARVVGAKQTIPVEAEAKAIRWAVASGARVINMSFGGLRSPNDATLDTYSRLEADAVAYAVRKGVLVVAAVGNSDQAPKRPWQFASYPAALPHVLGVSAVTRKGAAPPFSNRDAVYNDIAAPGVGILSLFPRRLTARNRGCAEQGYSSCGPAEYRRAEGTSFAAPQVAAAAATLVATRPRLQPDQVSALLERSAVDAKPLSGCARCAPGRDALTGWGRLDGAAALESLSAGPLPRPDRLEPNDDAGPAAVRLYGSSRTVRATLDFWDDQNDVYGVYLRRGQRLSASFRGPPASGSSLALWRPGTTAVDDLSRQDLRLGFTARPGARELLVQRADVTGWHYLQVKLGAPGAGVYRLSISKNG